MAQYDLSLLYVEDDIATATSMEIILKEYFKNIHVVNNSSYALKTFQENKIDIVLSDIELPDFSGLELIHKLKKMHSKLIVVLFSAYDDKEYLFEAIKLSICGYLVKPFHLDQFENVMQKCVQKLNEEKMHQLAYTDQLTGAYNRHKIVEMFTSLKNDNTPFGFIIMDIDDFKKINDTYGHTKGDFVLQQLVVCMKAHIRQNDFFGRWGGEEFVLFIPNIDSLALFNKADSLRHALAQHNYKLDKPVTVSMGIGLYEGESTFEQLVSKVDKALYKAKRDGKNRVVPI